MMMNPNNKHLINACALAVASTVWTAPAAAEGSWVSSLKDKVEEVKAGRVKPGSVHNARGVVDSWGPNGDDAANNPGSQDERWTDERQGPAPRYNLPPKKTTAQKAPAVVTTEPVATAAPSEASRYSTRRSKPTPTSTAGGTELSRSVVACANVDRVWEGAAVLAAKGQAKKAYSAYLGLLSSCNTNDELLGTVAQAAENLDEKLLEELSQEAVMLSSRNRAAHTHLLTQLMFKANDAGKSNRALSLSRQVRDTVLKSKNAGVLEVSGWLEQQAQEYKTAETLFRAGLKVEPDNQSMSEGLVYALLAQSKPEAAERELRRSQQEAPELMAEIRLAQARQALKQKRFDVALDRLGEAADLGLTQDPDFTETAGWALLGAKKYAEAAKAFEEVLAEEPRRVELQKPLIDALKASGRYEQIESIANSSSRAAGHARQALAERLDEQGRRQAAAKLTGKTAEGFGSSAAALVGIRSKTGDAGASQLSETELPVLNARVRVNDSAHVDVNWTRVQARDGVNSVSGNELRAKATVENGDTEITVGAGLSQVQGSNKVTFEGGIKQHSLAGHWEAGVRRAPVRDSVRSYAGATTQVPVGEPDPLTGEFETQDIRVGRAMQTSFYVGGSSLLDEVNRYKLNWGAQLGSVSSLGGNTNGFVAAQVRVEKEIDSAQWSWLSMGPYLNFASNQNDESGFGPTKAGYFSPKTDVGLGFGVNALSKEGRPSLFRVGSDLGFVSRKFEAGNGSDSGLSVNAAATAAWLLSPHLSAGVGVKAQLSPGYFDWGVKAGLVMSFERRTGLFASDLAPFQ